ncbi:MAG: hypothetical protein H0W84_11510, partial [Bacteroidetes bacterium]|nr:hypothetical protein [Bacteroidota bacterium]
QSSSRSQNGSWSPPQTISAPGTTGSFNPNTSNEALAVNAEGDVIAIWHQTNGNFPNSPVSAFKPFGLNWRPQEIIERTSDVYFTLTTLNIGLASCGFAVATWENSSATLIRASVNENLLTALNPIERLTRCVTVLTWDPNQDSCVLFYRIYRNGILIATIPRGQYRYVDSLGQNRTYEISTINVYGFEGDRIPFVIN